MHKAGCTLITLLFMSLTYASPPEHSQWELMPEFSDEFNSGSLNRSKWRDNNPYYSGSPPGIYARENPLVQGGKLLLTGRMKGDKITTSIIQSQGNLQYGYLEVRAKASASRLINAFWLYRYTDKATFEIDIVEMAGTAKGHEEKVHTNTHVYYGDPKLENEHNRTSTPYAWPSSKLLRKEFHTYALEWSQNELRWYFDGKIIRRKSNDHFYVPMRVSLTTETFPNWVGLPSRSELPAAMEVDYIRVYKQATQ